MDNQTNLEMILDHLAGTGVYVVRQDDHRILYYNERVRQVTPSVELGMVCHELWAGACQNCPLKTIGDLPSHTCVNYDDPFGSIVDISATRIQWENTIPAFLISVSPHIKTPDEAAAEGQARKLAEVLSRVYFFTVEVDVTEKRYNLLHYGEDSIPGLKNTGSYKELIACTAALVHPSHREAFASFFSAQSLMQLFSKDETSRYFEYRRKKSDGRYHWCSTRVVRTDGSDGHLRLMFLNTQIDERKELEQQRTEFSIAATAMFDECLVLNVTEGTFVARKGSKSLTGLPFSQGDYALLIQAYAEQLIYPPDRASFLQAFSLSNLREKAAEPLSVELRRKSMDGSYRWAEMTGVEVENAISTDRKMLLIYRDIHDFKMAQEAQQTSIRRFAAVVNKLYNFVYEGELYTGKMYIWQTDGNTVRQVEADETLEEYFQRTAAHTIYPDYREAYRAVYQIQHFREVYESGGKETFFEAPRKMPDGSYRWFAMQSQLIQRTPGELRVMFYQKDMDNAKREESERQNALRDALALAERANHAKTEFLSRMSHDIRTPMNGIIGMAALARADNATPEKITDCLNKIDTSAHFLLSLINDILDMSKIESGKMELTYAPFSLQGLIGNIAALTESQAKAKKQIFQIEIDPRLHKAYSGDALRLNQVLMNLVSNAHKYTPAGKHILLRVSLIEKRRHSTLVRFQVADEGLGMSREFLKHLYEPFEQESVSGGRIMEGSGLGLSITRNLVHLMHGQITVKSEPGKGTCFSVDVPLSHAGQDSPPALPLQAAPSLPADAENVFREKRILLAEDNAINLEIAQSFLEMKGFIIETAGNGKQAVELFTQHPSGYYALILMDIRMPVMDGLEATERIRFSGKEDAKSIPIIAMTANAFQEELETAVQKGMSAYLTKPIDAQVLYGALYRALAPEKEKSPGQKI